MLSQYAQEQTLHFLPLLLGTHELPILRIELFQMATGTCLIPLGNTILISVSFTKAWDTSFFLIK